MIYLALSILFSSGLFIIFKLFGVYKIDALKAIVVNYLVALTFGFLNANRTYSVAEIIDQNWFFGAVILGAMFVSVFFVMAKTSQVNGVSVASVAGKMSVVIPVFFGVFLYNETVTMLKISGIVIALIAVYLASVKNDNVFKGKSNLLFPALLFIGSGFIDTFLKYIETNYVLKEDVSIFSGTLFGIAAIFGIVILVLKSIKKPEAFGVKNIIAGIVLGIPNYYSIIFLIKALQVEGFESSTLFTLNNVGIVIFSTIIGVILFKEKLTSKNILGIILAILGIVMVTFAS